MVCHGECNLKAEKTVFNMSSLDVPNMTMLNAAYGVVICHYCDS